MKPWLVDPVVVACDGAAAYATTPMYRRCRKREVYAAGVRIRCAVQQQQQQQRQPSNNARGEGVAVSPPTSRNGVVHRARGQAEAEADVAVSPVSPVGSGETGTG